MKTSTLKTMVVICIYLMTGCLGLALWRHRVGMALYSSLLLLWQLESIKLLEKMEKDNGQ